MDLEAVEEAAAATYKIQQGLTVVKEAQFMSSTLTLTRQSKSFCKLSNQILME